MSFTRRPGWAALLPVAVVAALVLTACSSGGAPTDTAASVGALDPNQKVTITVWHGQTADAAQIMNDLAAEYMTAHPNVTVETASGASTTDDLLTKLSAGFASGDYPDVSYAYGNWATELGVSGRALDVSGNVQDPDVNWSDFPPAATKTATVDGKVIGFPAVVGDLGLIYNKDLFDAAHLAYPTNDWTWDDFRAAAKAITNTDQQIFGTTYPVNNSEDTTWRFWPQLWQNGGAILNADQTEATFSSQAGVDALTFWQQMAQDDKSVYLDQNGEKYGPLFLNNAIGMMITGPWMLYDLKHSDVNYGVTYLPGTDGDHQTIAGTDLWVMFNHDDPQRAAATYDFIKWLTQPEQDLRWNVALGNLPLRASEGDSAAFQKYVTAYPGADVFFANLRNAANPRPTIEGYLGLSEDIGKAIGQALVAGEDPKTVLDDAVQQANVDLAG